MDADAAERERCRRANEETHDIDPNRPAPDGNIDASATMGMMMAHMRILSLATIKAKARAPKMRKMTVDVKRKKNALVIAPEFCVPCKLPK